MCENSNEEENKFASFVEILIEGLHPRCRMWEEVYTLLPDRLFVYTRDEIQCRFAVIQTTFVCNRLSRCFETMSARADHFPHVNVKYRLRTGNLVNVI